MAVMPYPWQQLPAAQLEEMRDAMPNAILLYGAVGIGSFELARRFAESLFCEQIAKDGTPCGQCRGCELIAAQTHPDFQIVVSEAFAAEHDLPYVPADTDRPGKRKLSREVRIHQVRALSDFLSLVSHQGGRRIVLIYPADMVRAEAAASLLKSMEEPPDGLTFILVADDIDAVLPTIRSRSRLVRATSPSHGEALQWLQQEGVKNPEEVLALAGGAPLLALKDDRGLTLSDKAQKALLPLLEKGAALSAEEIVKGYNVDMTPPALSHFLSRWVHDLVGAKFDIAPRYFIQKADTLKALVRVVPLTALFALRDDVAQMMRASEHTLNARLLMETILLQYQTRLSAREKALS